MKHVFPVLKKVIQNSQSDDKSPILIPRGLYELKRQRFTLWRYLSNSGTVRVHQDGLLRLFQHQRLNFLGYIYLDVGGLPSTCL